MSYPEGDANLRRSIMPPLRKTLQHWRVSRRALRASDGRALLLRGVNLASAHKKPPYFGFHGEADFHRIRNDWGMNALRDRKSVV